MAHPDRSKSVRPCRSCSSSSRAALVPLSFSCTFSAVRCLRLAIAPSMPGSGSLQRPRSRDWMKGKEETRALSRRLGFKALSLRPNAACHDLRACSTACEHGREGAVQCLCSCSVAL